VGTRLRNRHPDSGTTASYGATGTVRHPAVARPAGRGQPRPGFRAPIAADAT
jgi:hypothetical protein